MIWWLGLFCFLHADSLSELQGTYVTGDETYELNVAVRVAIEGDRFLVDRWTRGKVDRLFDASVAHLRTDTEIEANVFLARGGRMEVFGPRNAPWSLHLKYDDRAHRLHVFVVQRGREEYRLPYPAYSALKPTNELARRMVDEGLDRRFTPISFTSFTSGRYTSPPHFYCASKI